MSSTTVQGAVLAAREAHEALMNLKNLAEEAANKIHSAEREAVGRAVSSPPRESALGTLRDAAKTLESLPIETAVREARAKTERVLQAAGPRPNAHSERA